MADITPMPKMRSNSSTRWRKTSMTSSYLTHLPLLSIVTVTFDAAKTDVPTLLKAFEKIKHGGILFTFSCSQAVNKDQFRTSVFTAAAASGRKVSILHQLTQPADHPVNIYHPEGEYLKGLVLYVE